MLFNSYIFILVFLPLVITGYFVLNKRKLYTAVQVFVLGMSLWFYGYFNVRYLALILGSIGINYLVYSRLNFVRGGVKRKTLLIGGLLFNLGLLFYYKYLDFFISNINTCFKKDYTLLQIVLPLGISFFTFQQISFIIDAYKKQVPKYNLLYYSSFVTFFPQLIAGPIVTHDELIPQFMDETRKRLNWDNLAKGIYIFVLGMFKKVILADTFGNAVNWGFQNIDALDTTNAVIVMLAYTMQIYFDFSGYCDMAVGIGKMLNIDLPLNFNSPYKALTITEFWDRWHITLTRFLTKYVYIPLGGSRKGKFRTYINIMIVFLVSGLWHGANWSFVMWGALHGIFMIVTRHFSRFFERRHPAFNWLITFSFINITWVLFRAESIRKALAILNKIILLEFGAINENINTCFQLRELQFLIGITNVETLYPHFLIMMFFIVALAFTIGGRNAFERMEAFKPSIKNLLAIAFLMVWCICSLSGMSTFLYFNF